MPARPGSVMSPLHLSDKGFQSTRVYMFICIRTHIQYRVHIDRPVYSVDHHRPNVRMYDVPFHLSPSQFYPIVSVSRQTFNFYITKHSKITLDVYNMAAFGKALSLQVEILQATLVWTFFLTINNYFCLVSILRSSKRIR